MSINRTVHFSVLLCLIGALLGPARLHPQPSSLETLSCENALERVWNDKGSNAREVFERGIAHNLSPATNSECGSEYLKAIRNPVPAVFTPTRLNLYPSSRNGTVGQQLLSNTSERATASPNETLDENTYKRISVTSAQFENRLLYCTSFQAATERAAKAMAEQPNQESFRSTLRKQYADLGQALDPCLKADPALMQDMQAYLAATLRKTADSTATWSDEQSLPVFAHRGKGPLHQLSYVKTEGILWTALDKPFSVAPSTVPLHCVLYKAVAPTRIMAAAYVDHTDGKPTVIDPAVDGQSFDVPIVKPGLYVVNATINHTDRLVYVVEYPNHTRLLWIADMTDNFFLQVTNP
jgi:hypothetical protein